MRFLIGIGLLLLMISCDYCNPKSPNHEYEISFQTIDTEFSKGRLNHVQTHTLQDLEKFHGHLCDGLVVGTMAIIEGMKWLYPNAPIDRTNLRIVSRPSPCLTDVAIYITGGRYQFNTFYVDNDLGSLYIIQRIDNLKTISIALKEGIKPTSIDSLGSLAIQQQLTPCEIDHLRALEDQFIIDLLHSNHKTVFNITELEHFEWNPTLQNNFIKTDIINKEIRVCP